MTGQYRGKHPGATADIEHFTFGVRLQGRQQQLAADIKAVAAEHARQRFNGQIIERVLVPVLFGVEGGLADSKSSLWRSKTSLAGVKADMKHSFNKTGADYSSLLAQIRRICYIARLFNRSVSL